MKEYGECVGRQSVYQSHSKSKSHLNTYVCNTSGHLSFQVKTKMHVQNHQSDQRKDKEKKPFIKLSAALGELPPPLLLQNRSMDFNSGSLECDVSHISLWKY